MKQTLINKVTNFWNKIKPLLIITAGVIAVCLFIYFAYWLTKSGSYVLFYEDMVQDTIREMVKDGALK